MREIISRWPLKFPCRYDYAHCAVAHRFDITTMPFEGRVPMLYDRRGHFMVIAPVFVGFGIASPPTDDALLSASAAMMLISRRLVKS